MMVRAIMCVLSLAMIGCLTAYAIGHIAAPREGAADRGNQRIAAPVNSPNGNALLPMRPMSDQELAAADQQRARQRQKALHRELAQRDDEIVGQLRLSEEQMRQYLALREEIRLQSEELKTFQGNRIERGMEINQQLHRALREIFTPEQYAMYRRLWNAPAMEPSGDAVAEKVNGERPESSGQADAGQPVDEEAPADSDHPW